MTNERTGAEGHDTIRPQDRERLNAIARACAHHRALGPRLGAEIAGHLVAIFLLCFGAAGAPSFAVGALVAGYAALWGYLAWRRLMRLLAEDEAAQRRIVVTARGIRDPKAAFRLLDLAFEVRDPERQQVIAAASRLVAEMDDDTAAAFTPAQLDIIRTLLAAAGGIPTSGASPDERRVTIGILRIMAARGYQPARREAALIANSWSAPDVRDAALACLTRLEELESSAVLRDSLLRPTDAPADQTLLRPAEPAGEEQLPRPAEGEQD